MNWKAGLGLLGSIGDNKAADSIEDTAVELSDLQIILPSFLRWWSVTIKAIYYAHAGAELHLRPVLNLKKRKSIHQFRNATEVAVLVKKNTVVH
jgi:hypothetical protein